MDNIKRQVLEKLGLSRNEAAVYMALMSLGSATAGQVTKESGLHRRNVYDALEKLVRRGLVGFVNKGKIRHFEATDPHRILDLLREKRQELENEEKRLTSLMKDLVKARESRESQDVSIFFGKEGRRLVFEGILRERENCLLGGYGPTSHSINYIKQWHRRRIRAGVRDRMIYNRQHAYIEYLKELDLTEVRLMPKELGSKVSFNIYGNNVGIFFWIDSLPVTILIENHKVANDFREYFNFIWELCRPA